MQIVERMPKKHKLPSCSIDMYDVDPRMILYVGKFCWFSFLFLFLIFIFISFLFDERLVWLPQRSIYFYVKCIYIKSYLCILICTWKYACMHVTYWIWYYLCLWKHYIGRYNAWVCIPKITNFCRKIGCQVLD